MDISNFLRQEVVNFEPYLPGKPIDEVKRELGLKKIVKLASNENALGTSRKVLASLRRNRDGFFRYPEGAGTLLRRALARHLNVDDSEIILGAGSDDLIEILGKTFFNRDDEIIVSEHAFIRYRMAADLMGAKSVVVPMKNFTHDLDAMASAVTPKTKAIFVANPNNPTGTYVNQNAVKGFFSRFSSQTGKDGFLDRSQMRRPGSLPFVVFDEAYYEYAKRLVPDYPETIEYFRKGFNLVILRTFSKIYGLAGLRVGYGIASKEVISALDRVRLPFNVSSIAQSAAINALSDFSHINKSVSVVKKGLDFLRRELERLNLGVLPTSGNFLMVDVSPRKGKDLFEGLLKKGVIVRAMDEYGFPCHFRVTVGLPEENRFFVQKLKEVLKKK